MKQFTVSAWRNGKSDSATFGFRLGRFRDAVFAGARPQTVQLRLENGPTITVTLHDSFWRKCPEFRHAAIRAWLKTRRRHKWQKGKPHKFNLEQHGSILTVRR